MSRRFMSAATVFAIDGALAFANGLPELRWTPSVDLLRLKRALEKAWGVAGTSQVGQAYR